MKSIIFLIPVIVSLTLIPAFSQEYGDNDPSSIVCDSHYPDFCIAAYPPDLNCGDISHNAFTVLQPDPHGFDRDKDGVGCGTKQQDTPFDPTITELLAIINDLLERIAVLESFHIPDPPVSLLQVSVEKGDTIPTVGTVITILVTGANGSATIEIMTDTGEVIKTLKGVLVSNQGVINLPWIIPKDIEPGIYTVRVIDAFDSAETTFEFGNSGTNSQCGSGTIFDPESNSCVLVVPETQIEIGEPYFENNWSILIEGSGFYPDIDGSIRVIDSQDWNNFAMIANFGDTINIDSTGSFSTIIPIRYDYIQSGNYDVIINDIEEHTFSENYIQFNDFDADFITYDFSTTNFKVNEEKILDVTGNIQPLPEYDSRNEYIHIYIFKDNFGSLQTGHRGTWSMDDILNENGDFHMATNALFIEAGQYKPLFSYEGAHIWGPTITVIE